MFLKMDYVNSEYFTLFPMIAEVDCMVEFELSCINEKYKFYKSEDFALKMHPLNRAYDVDPSRFVIRDYSKDAQVLKFQYCFDFEDEYVLEIIAPDFIAKIPVYALQKDLYSRRPLRGDLHLHSNRSDGVPDAEDIPPYYRKLGYDFIALTDHYWYDSSVRMKEHYASIETDMVLMAGEELHMGQNDCHFLQVNGSSSVNEMYRRDEEAYRREVLSIQESLIEEGMKEDTFIIASAIWMSRHVRETGGLFVLCHPFWFVNGAFHYTESLVRHLTSRKIVDAMEIVSGQSPAENSYQIAYYYQLREEGIRIPVIGVSDTHDPYRDTELYGQKYSIVFAPENEANVIVRAIREGFSLAVEKSNGSIDYRVEGPYRLHKYARFLIDAYYPKLSTCYETEAHYMKILGRISEEEDKFHVEACLKRTITQRQELEKKLFPYKEEE